MAVDHQLSTICGLIMKAVGATQLDQLQVVTTITGLSLLQNMSTIFWEDIHQDMGKAQGKNY